MTPEERIEQAKKNWAWWKTQQALGYVDEKRDFEWLLRDLELAAGARSR